MRKLWLTLLLISLSFGVSAETPEEKGYAIALEIDQRDTGWHDEVSSVKMILRNAHGESSVRENRMKMLEVDGDGDKTLIIFDNPRDLAGTAFLTFAHSRKPDEQWMYLPALKRVKRISSSNKSGPFLGSEFAYEDISSEEVDKYSYKYLRDEVLSGKDSFVMERYPEYKHSGYKRQVVWVDKEIYRILKIDYYDRKNSLLKTLTFHDMKFYLDKFWRPSIMEMVNHQTKKSTTLEWTERQFNTGLTSRDFDRNSLKRAR